MSRVAELPSRNALPVTSDADRKQRQPSPLSAVMSSSDNQSDPMEITSPTPPDQKPTTEKSDMSDANKANGAGAGAGASESANNSNATTTTSAPGQTLGAAAAAQQPKVVQTAFIHKLYKYGCRVA